MPTYEHDDSEATRFLVNNEHGRWYKIGIDVDDQAGDFAVQRLKHRLFEPAIPDPCFRMGRNDALFAIGSCFARGIESAMVGAGFDVRSAAREFDDFELRVEGVTGLGFMNKYTTHSIRAEIEWALDPQSTFPKESLVDVGDDEWIDPSTNPTLRWVNLDATLERRSTITEVVRRSVDCRVIVVTLGLVELWFDHESGIHLNMAPTPAMRERHPGRYTFEVSNFIENRENMEAVGDLFDQHGHPDVQLVVTTSPVPLMATFTNRDVVVANTYSKSVLRAVAEDFAASRPNVHYFPSFEIVMNSDRGAAWADDGRHVQPEVVNHIMALFQHRFVAD